MTVSLATVISQLMPVLAALPSDAHLTQPAAIMTLSPDSLINQSVTLKVLGAATNAQQARTAIINATVIASSPLLSNADSDGHYKLLLSDGKQQFEMISKAALHTGARLQLKLDGSLQSAVLLKVLDGKPPNLSPARGLVVTPGTGLNPGNAASPDALSAMDKALLTQTTGSATALNETNLTASAKTSASSMATGKDAALSSVQLIEQAMRHALPKQQPTRELVMLLQQVLQQPSDLPAALTRSLTNLLQQFPTAGQMQQTQPVKQAISNSGVFLEGKLAHLAMSNRAGQIAGNNKPNTVSQLQQDIKALLQSLALELAKQSPSKPGASHSALASPQQNSGKLESGFMPYALTPSTTPAQKTNGQASTEQNLDIILRQLSRQLLASIARTQLNQLESLVNRQTGGADNQGPVNSWVTEIPIVHGKHVDNLHVRIDQEFPDEAKQREEKTQKLWTVMLAFDLHALGKMNVQLRIVNQSVAATVWSSQESTHAKVKQHVEELTDNLKKTGVSVTSVDCQLGLPPAHKSPLQQQLVDVRT